MLKFSQRSARVIHPIKNDHNNFEAPLDNAYQRYYPTWRYNLFDHGDTANSP